ncbi:MAG: c-type cytochrome [Pseudomonadota bacterium]
MRVSLTAGLLALTMTSALACAAACAGEGDASAGAPLYAPCSACHGAGGEGNAALRAPRLQGLAPWYVVRQLKNFKDGLRGADERDTYGAQMRPMAMTLKNDTAIADVAAHVVTLTTAEPAAATVEGNLASGKAAYAVCAACHGARGEGNEVLNAPRLAGQADWYLATQLKNFKAGVRGKHKQDAPGAQMWPMAMTLATDEAIADVVAYIATLR